MHAPFRHTKIIFTIGPATAKPEVLKELLSLGVDVCRLNMAHADHTWTRETVAMVRAACKEAGRDIALMMDVKGPEIRTGDVESAIDLKTGETFDFYTSTDAQPTGGVRGVTVNYPSLARDVKEGDTVLVDSGLIRMIVEQVFADRVRCRVEIPAVLKNRRHINLPGVKVNLPCLTAKDVEDIKVGIELGIDLYALSFVREPEDIEVLRRHLTERGSQGKIVAKIEDQCAINNLEEIIRAADGLMVARGDLGIEIPIETLPVVQRRAVKSCLRLGKPVIVATHLLESMCENPVPTRAEITDIANAVQSSADCVMLSGETTTGKYPLDCVRVFNKVIRATEEQEGPVFNPEVTSKHPKALLMRAAVVMADEWGDAGILAFTRNGLLIQTLSSLRPRHTPIYAFTDNDRTFRQIRYLWGIEPFLLNFSIVPEKTISDAMKMLVERKYCSPGSKLVIITNVIAGEKIVDSVQVRLVE